MTIMASSPVVQSVASAEVRPQRNANADWLRALERTAGINPGSERTLARAVEEHAASFGDRLALTSETGDLTYAALAELSNRYSRWALRLGLAPGDRVALMMGNNERYVAIWLGLTRVGVVAALINPQLVGESLAHCVAIAEPKAAIVDVAGLDHLLATQRLSAQQVWIAGAGADPDRSIDRTIAELPGEPLSDAERRPVLLEAPALLIYTSGTTGFPKAARVSHFRVMMWSEWFAGILNARGDDRLYNCLPMYHSVGGVVAIGAMLCAGGATIVRKSFSLSRFWPDIVASRATIFQYIGELCRYLANATQNEFESQHALRLCCGNGLRGDVWPLFESRFNIPRVIEFYASTEGSFSLFNLEGKPGAVGRVPGFMAHRSPIALIRLDPETQQPVRDEQGHVVRCDRDEPGEAIGRVSANARSLADRFEGYSSETETDRKILRDAFEPGDRWFRSGDLMRRDRQGFYYFVDRLGDTFRWKGENVSTMEVAEVIAACPGVLDVAVYGVEVPHADGRAGMAALVAGPEFSLAALHELAHTRLPRFARPLFLRVHAQMAVTSTFKVVKAVYAREGFDPARVTDELYLDDPRDGHYRVLDLALHRDITSGALKL